MAKSWRKQNNIDGSRGGAGVWTPFGTSQVAIGFLKILVWRPLESNGFLREVHTILCEYIDD